MSAVEGGLPLNASVPNTNNNDNNNDSNNDNVNISIGQLTAEQIIEQRRKRKREQRAKQRQKQREQRRAQLLSVGPAQSQIHSFANNVLLFPNSITNASSNPVNPANLSAVTNQLLQQYSKGSTTQRISDNTFIFPAPNNIENKFDPTVASVAEPTETLLTLNGPTRYNQNKDLNPIPMYSVPLDIHARLVASTLCTPTVQHIEAETYLVPNKISMSNIDTSVQNALGNWLTEMTIIERNYLANSNPYISAYEATLERERIETNEAKLYAMHESAMDKMLTQLKNMQADIENIIQLQSAPINLTNQNAIREIRLNTVAAAIQAKAGLHQLHEAVDELQFIHEIKPTKRSKLA